jgi:hypothetical protein
MSGSSFNPPENEQTPSSERRRNPGHAPTLQEAAEVDFRLAMDTILAIVWTASANGSDDFFNRGWVEYTNLSVDDAFVWIGFV